MARLKTVQEVLRELDTDRLIGAFRYAHPFEYEENAEMRDLTVRQIQDRVKEALSIYIERLRTIPMKAPEDDHRGLLYVHRQIKDGISDRAFGMCFMDELIEKGVECPNYACEFSDQAEIMGFLVADTPLTQRYLYNLMANVMFEASFFGFEQESLHSVLDSLKQAEQESREGKTKYRSFEEVIAEIGEKYGFEPDIESADEKALRRKVMEAEMAYNQHSRRKELALIRSSLLKQARADT